MESPTKLSGDAIRDARLAVLRNLSCDDGIYGQYRGYREEPGVKPDSHTETYALLKCAINTPRWLGVPFYVMTGKKLAHIETVIYIKFKTVDCLLAKQCPSPANWLTIRVAPEGIFSLTLNGKDPEKSDATVPIEMSFCHSCIFETRSTQAYEQAISEVLRGEQSASVRFDEIDASWQFIDTVLQKKFPLYQYEPGTEGPAEITAFAKRNGVKWHI
jgi:glucose-6-phosphate 1-dehydrogenase